MLGAQLTSRVAEAGRALSRAHPLFSAPCLGDFFVQQARTEAAIADRGSWRLVDLSALGQNVVVSPDLTRAAACTGDQLLLWTLDDLQPAATPLVVPLEQPSSDSPIVCTWSASSDVVCWQQWSSSAETAALSVSLYRCSTGELRSAVLLECQRWEFLLYGHVPCGDGFLEYSGTPSSTLPHLCVVSWGADSQLRTEVCPVSLRKTQRHCNYLAVSVAGCLAFPDVRHTLCFWQPSAELCRVPLVPIHLTWDPSGSVLLNSTVTAVCFLDSQGVLLSSQNDYSGLQPPVWGPSGVVVTGPKREEIHFFAVLDGPRLQLQHCFVLPPNTWPSSYLTLSADHFAFLHQAVEESTLHEPFDRHLAVVKSPWAAAACSLDQDTHIAAAPASNTVGSAPALCICHVDWLHSGRAVQCQLPLDHESGRLRTVLVQFC